MKPLLNDRSPSTVLIITTAVVITILAVLLYRWSNQVSEATTVRLADSLQMSMVNWHLNLFRDLSDVCLALRDDAGRGHEDVYARRFGDWRSGAPYPDVVASLYILRPGAAPHRSALRLDPAAQRFEPAVWPSRFDRLYDEFRRLASLPQDSRRSAAAFYPPGGGLAGWSFDPVSLSLVRPFRSDAGESSAAEDWIVIELNRDVIQNRILPDLAYRYFMGVDGLDYLVAVVAGTAKRQVIYSSDPGFGEEEVADADGRMDVFGDITKKAFGSSIYVFHKLSENARLSELTASIGASWFPLIGTPSENQHWQLIVRHRRGGALGAFVAEMHRRDLAISFGLLSLLVVSVAMLIVTSQRAHRLAKLQMGFVTAVSHELRTPLTIISSAAQNIGRGVVEDNDQVKQYGRVIETQAGRLSGLLEEILLFAAAKENRLRYNPRPLDAAEIIEAALASAAGLIEASRFTVVREIPHGLPKVMGDLPALTQCLQNLITNALKYGGESRWLGIRASLVEAPAAGAEIQISVSDRGMGVDPRDAPHIFEPFYRSPSATAAQIHGTGLGLSLAKSIAEAMHGRLTLKSAPGAGSTFTLHLPCLGSESQ